MPVNEKNGKEKKVKVKVKTGQEEQEMAPGEEEGPVEETAVAPEAAERAITDPDAVETAVAAEEKDLSLEEQLEVARAEAARNLDGWMRAQAEFANARKRFQRERTNAYTNATAEVVQQLLPALDDFERAIGNAPQAVQENEWFEGIVLVQRKLDGILERLNVQPIEAVGEPFDPNLHEAIMQEESDEYESGVVTREMQKGYKMGDKVIRPTMVYVAA